MSATQTRPRAERRIIFSVWSIIAGAIGWFASFELLNEYIKTLREPTYTPNCDVSVLVTCGPNMDSWQGSILGFPNPIIGVSAFIAPMIVGVTLLAVRELPGWYWRCYMLGLTLGLVFVTWLQYQSVVNLGTLCPWCMVVWLVMIPLWWSSFTTLLRRGDLGGYERTMRVGAHLHAWCWVAIVLHLLTVAVFAQLHLNWLFTEFGLG